MKKANISVNRGRIQPGGSPSPVKNKEKGKKTKDLNITSLIDILTILLVFMIKNVSMDAAQKNAPTGMTMPTTYNKNELIENGDAVFVKIFAPKIENGELIEGKILYGKENILVGTLDEFVSDIDIQRVLLKYLQLESKQISKTVDNEGNNKIPCLLIQADKTLDCKYITQFIKFSAGASFANIYFSTIHTPNADEVLGLIANSSETTGN